MLPQQTATFGERKKEKTWTSKKGVVKIEFATRNFAANIAKQREIARRFFLPRKHKIPKITALECSVRQYRFPAYVNAVHAYRYFFGEWL
jgi:hypothetical protein